MQWPLRLAEKAENSSNSRNNFFSHRAGFSAQSFFATFFNMFACGEIIKNKFTERSLH